jgi:hypothetical protein
MLGKQAIEQESSHPVSSPALLEQPLEADAAKCARRPFEQSEAVIVPLTIETTQLDAGKGRDFNQLSREVRVGAYPRRVN